MKKFLILLIFFCSELNAQNVRLFQYSTNASGTCDVWNLAQNTTTGALFYCKSIPPTTAWTPIPVGSSNLTIGSAGLIANGLVYADTTNSVVSTSVLNNGQLLIGRTSLTPVVAYLTAGSGISVANGSGSITLSTSNIPSSSLNITTTNCTNQAVTAIASNGVGTCSSLNKTRIISDYGLQAILTGSPTSVNFTGIGLETQFSNSADGSVLLPQFEVPPDATSSQSITLTFGYNANSAPGTVNNKFTFKIKCTKNGVAGSFTSTDTITASNDTTTHLFTGINTICTTITAADLLTVELYRVVGGANDAAVPINISFVGFQYTSTQ